MFRYLLACFIIAAGVFHGYGSIQPIKLTFYPHSPSDSRALTRKPNPSSPLPTYLVNPAIHVLRPWPLFNEGQQIAINYPILGGGQPNLYRRQAAPCPTGTTTCGASGSCCTQDQNCWVQNNGECANKGTCPGSHPTLCHNMTADPNGQNSNEFYCCDRTYVCTPTGCEPSNAPKSSVEPVTVTVKQVSFITQTPEPTTSSSTSIQDPSATSSGTLEPSPTDSTKLNVNGTLTGGNGEGNGGVKNLGGIIGGTLAGALVVGLLAAAWYWHRGRQPRPPPPAYTPPINPFLEAQHRGQYVYGASTKPELPAETSQRGSMYGTPLPAPVALYRPLSGTLNNGGSGWATPNPPVSNQNMTHNQSQPLITRNSYADQGNAYRSMPSVGGHGLEMPPLSPRGGDRPRGAGGMDLGWSAAPVQETTPQTGYDGLHELQGAQWLSAMDPQQAEYMRQHELPGSRG